MSSELYWKVTHTQHFVELECSWCSREVYYTYSGWTQEDIERIWAEHLKEDHS